MKSFFIFLLVLIILFNIVLWHKTNVSVDFIHEYYKEFKQFIETGEKAAVLEKYTKDGFLFFCDLKHAIELYYFEMESPSMILIKVFTDRDDIEAIHIKHWTLIIEDIGVELHSENILESKPGYINFKENFDRTVYKNTPLNIYDDRPGTKYGWSSRFLLGKFLPDTINKEKDLKRFRKIKEVKFITVFEYKVNNEIREINITSIYRPKVRVSSAFWDKWMSV
ncbi:hypothetical protein [Treponema putidum]|uniref:Uncharacterized protein n=1 Tax=Treponema putidum TaxID=221027 RepID=A0AAE9MS76_9SPIR|nr:hypothetical protein [Treponema putidum]UTY32645.1 hypothetical protein E4N74_00400 [Treponema putidum]